MSAHWESSGSRELGSALPRALAGVHHALIDKPRISQQDEGDAAPRWIRRNLAVAARHTASLQRRIPMKPA